MGPKGMLVGGVGFSWSGTNADTFLLPVPENALKSHAWDEANAIIHQDFFFISTADG